MIRALLLGSADIIFKVMLPAAMPAGKRKLSCTGGGDLAGLAQHGRGTEFPFVAGANGYEAGRFRSAILACSRLQRWSTAAIDWARSGDDCVSGGASPNSVELNFANERTRASAQRLQRGDTGEVEVFPATQRREIGDLDSTWTG